MAVFIVVVAVPSRCCVGGGAGERIDRVAVMDSVGETGMVVQAAEAVIMRRSGPTSLVIDAAFRSLGMPGPQSPSVLEVREAPWKRCEAS